MDVIYFKVEESDDNFYKGLALSFNKDETKLKGIFPENWMDYKSVGYLITEITELKFNEKFKKAIAMLKDIKTI